MDKAEFDALKATFPWREQVIPTRVGGLVQVIDRNGNEVPIFTMTGFLKMITAKLAVESQEENKGEAA